MRNSTWNFATAIIADARTHVSRSQPLLFCSQLNGEISRLAAGLSYLE
jgi:hypothetical protein